MMAHAKCSIADTTADSDEANFVDSLKAVDKSEEFKLIKQRVKEDQYALRKAKKPLAKGMRMRKKAQTFKAKKPFKKTTKPAEAKPAEATTQVAAPSEKAAEAK